jgi:hypothetical protein
MVMGTRVGAPVDVIMMLRDVLMAVVRHNQPILRLIMVEEVEERVVATVIAIARPSVPIAKIASVKVVDALAQMTAPAGKFVRMEVVKARPVVPRTVIV